MGSRQAQISTASLFHGLWVTEARLRSQHGDARIVLTYRRNLPCDYLDTFMIDNQQVETMSRIQEATDRRNTPLQGAEAPGIHTQVADTQAVDVIRQVTIGTTSRHRIAALQAGRIGIISTAPTARATSRPTAQLPGPHRTTPVGDRRAEARDGTGDRTTGNRTKGVRGIRST